MSLKLRQKVPQVWVLLCLVTFSASEISYQFEDQFWAAELSDSFVKPDTSLVHTASPRTVQALSCSHGKMSLLSVEQKQNIKILYKTAHKVAHSEAHIQFLEKCLLFRL